MRSRPRHRRWRAREARWLFSGLRLPEKRRALKRDSKLKVGEYAEGIAPSVSPFARDAHSPNSHR